MKLDLTSLKEKSFKIRGPITLINTDVHRPEIFLADTKSVGYNCQNDVVAFCDGAYVYVIPHSPEVIETLITCKFKKTKMKVPFSHSYEPANPKLKEKWEAVKTKMA